MHSTGPCRPDATTPQGGGAAALVGLRPSRGGVLWVVIAPPAAAVAWLPRLCRRPLLCLAYTMTMSDEGGTCLTRFWLLGLTEGLWCR
jgi:hypothetical protein